MPLGNQVPINALLPCAQLLGPLAVASSPAVLSLLRGSAGQRLLHASSSAEPAAAAASPASAAAAPSPGRSSFHSSGAASVAPTRAVAVGPSWPSAASPLQVRLAEAGVPDWQEYGAASYRSLDGHQQWEFVYKVAELYQEGLTAETVLQLFSQPASPRRCSLEGAFLPNLHYLRTLMAGVRFARARFEPPGLTPVGRLLRSQPRDGAYLLSRNPAAAAQLDCFLHDELKVGRPALAAASLEQPRVLYVPVANAREVVRQLGDWGVPRPHVAALLLKEPCVFEACPDALAANLAKLRATLGLSEDSAVLELVLRPLAQPHWQPFVLARPLPELPVLLATLDKVLGSKGAGAELVKRAPVVATLSLNKLERSLVALRTMGLSEAQVREVVGSWGQAAPGDGKASSPSAAAS